MTTEIEVPNPNLELVPGMYARVLLPVERHPQALAIPIQAVPPGQTNSVYVVNDQNEIEEKPVTLGLDTPSKYQVIAGLKEGEKVLTGRFSEVHPGQKVEARMDTIPAKEEAQVVQKQ
jgi:multidrug efflux pump subunit AcrA (membrane-fusion protein)